jgi:hypothetical protein
VGNITIVGSPYLDKSRLRAFVNNLYKKNWGIAHFESRKPAKNNGSVANRTPSF